MLACVHERITWNSWHIIANRNKPQTFFRDEWQDELREKASKRYAPSALSETWKIQISTTNYSAVRNCRVQLSVDLATRPDPVVVNVVTGLTLSAKILLICYRRALNELKCGFNGLRLIKLDFQKSWMHGHFGRLSTVKQLKITKRKSERERFRKQAHIWWKTLDMEHPRMQLPADGKR